MRLPIVPQISTKDGVSNKNARLTNCLKESKKSGDKAVVRPGLVLDAQASGVGHGLVVFNNELVSVYGATLGLNTEAVAGADSAAYSVGTGGLEVHATIWLSTGRWLVGGLDFDDEVAYIYTGDGEGVMTLDTSGYTGGNDIFCIATSGTSVLIGSGNGSGLGGSPQVQRSLISGALSFSDVTTGGGSQVAQGLRYYNGTYVACYTLTTSNAIIARSTDDGVSWNTATLDVVGARDVMWDGSQWVVVGWYDSGGTVAWMKTSSDLITFSPVSFTGYPSSNAPTLAVYGQGKYFIFGSGVGGAELWESSNYTAWTQVTGDFRGLCVDEVGAVYATKFTGQVYKTIAGTLTEIDVATNPGYMIHLSASDSDSAMLGTNLSNYIRVSFAAGDPTIPALATITGDYYDFAQSPL